MVGAMRKMAVYLGLVEDDGYDGRGFDPDDDFEPEPEPEREHRRHQPVHQQEREREREREEPMRVVQPPRNVNASANRCRWGRKSGVRRESPPWHPSHLNVRVWRRTHR